MRGSQVRLPVTRKLAGPLNSAIVTVSEVVCELLNVSVTVNSTVCVPEVVNGCLGAGSVEVTPSPKFQK